jgi:hypothetical protein
MRVWVTKQKHTASQRALFWLKEETTPTYYDVLALEQSCCGTHEIVPIQYYCMYHGY